MGTFLAVFGGVLAAMALFLLLVYIWIRMKIRGFVRQISDAIEGFGALAAAAPPPMRLELEEEDDSEWIDEETVEGYTALLEGQGFQQAGDYQAYLNAMVRMRGFANPDQFAYAVIYEVLVFGDLPPIPVWFEFTSKFTDGSSVTYGSIPSPESPVPPWATRGHFPDSDLLTIWRRFLAERPQKEMLPTPPGDFVQRLKDAYAREMDWLAERGGPSPEDIRRQAAAGAGVSAEEMTDEQVEQIRNAWLQHFNQFYAEQFHSAYMQSSQLSIPEWEKVNHRLSFVHDRLTIDEVIGRFEDAIYDEIESASEEEDGDGDEWEEAAEAARSQMREAIDGLTPREAFAELNSRIDAAHRFEPYGRCDKPFTADVYLEPSWDDE